MIYERKSRLRGLGFTAVLCVCMLCVGAATWIGINSMNDDVPIDSTSSAVSAVSSVSNSSAASGTHTSSAGQISSAAASRTTGAADTQSAESEQVLQAASPSAGFFVMPITGEIIKPFDDSKLQYSMTYKDWRLHTGVDIAADKGAEIRSAGDGTVKRIYEDSMYGNVIEIDHGNGITGIYCSIDSIKVKEGDTVEANTLIGSLGMVPCESVEQVHLHFSLLKDGKPVAPSDMIGVN